MKRPLWLTLVTLVLLCRAGFAAAVPPAPTFAAQWATQGRAVFEVRHAGSGLVVGRSEHRWQHDGRRWSLRLATEPAGVAALFSKARAVQESHGIFVPGGLQPLEFRSEKNGKPKGSARFDPVAGRIELGTGERVPMNGQTQDLLSLFYQLGAEDLTRSRFTLALTTGRKLAAYQVSVRGTQTLDSGVGQHQVRHLRIVPAGDAQQAESVESTESTEVWLDTTSRLPVRIRHRDRKGDVFDQILMSLEPGSQK